MLNMRLLLGPLELRVGPICAGAVGAIVHGYIIEATSRLVKAEFCLTSVFYGRIICVPNLHTLKDFDWSPEKNDWLKKNRGMGFEEVLFYISEEGHLLDDVVNPKRPKQKMYIVEIDSYVYLVPYVQKEDEIFLKTIYPSRKATKHYLNLKS